MTESKQPDTMSEISIDQSQLPGVKEVCRDFAVLEDHTLAHNLQEQEIEHHLATNIQRNRLVKHDLKVAKQLQEEEDHRACTQVTQRHNDLELLDCEIAQEIQEKLVIESERRRRQEENDEDIARILQEKEEKRRKKHPPGPPAQEEPYYPDSAGHRSKGTRDSPHKPTGGMRNVEVYDAKIARRLQEEELKANKVDLRAAQVAQDEEIARLLMEKEQKAYIKSKGREKIMSDKKRADEREPDTYAHVRPRSKEGHEQHRSRSDKPYRPLPPSPDEDFDGDYGRDCTSRNQHNSPRSNSKSESSPKGSYYRR
ncbi:coiled-coil domain-containing protein 50 isoform X2 [Ascaphus truei]|uniref:coiled-coil domain-containing protein 50 isoform X2 n=1 Tax=Ascaphus truei TaxID=8439 RepID=UPI003F59FF84